VPVFFSTSPGARSGHKVMISPAVTEVANIPSGTMADKRIGRSEDVILIESFRNCAGECNGFVLFRSISGKFGVLEAHLC